MKAKLAPVGRKCELRTASREPTTQPAAAMAQAHVLVGPKQHDDPAARELYAIAVASSRSTPALIEGVPLKWKRSPVHRRPVENPAIHLTECHAAGYASLG